MKKNQIYFLVIIALVAVLGWQVWSINSNSSQKTAVSTNAEVVMYKNPGCRCCDKWAAHMEQAGFTVAVKPLNYMPRFKKEHGITYKTASCHTAIINGYVVEGHVPASDVKKLLKKEPKAIGLAVPGMPQGAPGMPSPNPKPYTVYLVKPDGSTQVFAKYNQ